MENTQNNPHEMDRVSFTADAIAARRTLMDIPYAQATYNVLLEKVSGTPAEQELADALKPENLHLVPFFEARYLLLDRLVRASGSKKIIELAAGLAPRGLNWTDDPEVEYVELDLPRKSAQKRELIEALAAQSPTKERQNLHLEPGDALNPEDLARSAGTFHRKGPIVIANEGLLRYLNLEQKKTLASNILATLKTHGGYWITPDINTPDQSHRSDPQYLDYLNRISVQLKMDIDANLFPDVASAKIFFEGLGFIIEEHSFREVIPQMVSPARLNFSPDETEKMIGWRVAFVMKLAAA